MEDVLLLIIAISVNIPIGIIARKRRTLSFPSGLIGATIVGIISFLAHPIIWISIMAFFVSSTFIGKYKAESQQKLAAISFAEKGGERDIWQVFANGGVATFLSFIILFMVGANGTGITNSLVVAAVTSVAASAADTWATEVGTTSKNEPRWILQPWEKVPRGTSGGVSVRGFIGTIFGASIISAIYFLGSNSPLAILVMLGGILGSLIDTLLGASVQASYFCNNCQKDTERKLHKCGNETTLKKGIKIISNDFVNLLSGLIASGIIYSIIS